jgi:NitT/TauT family transport system substrate-binding protein
MSQPHPQSAKQVFSYARRILLTMGVACALCMPAHAADKLRFLNDWRWEGPAAPLLMAASKGYFQKEGLDVALTLGTGSAATVAKVASGEFDMGFGDFSALVEHAGKNPAAAPPVAVYVVYERNPSALFCTKPQG